MAGWIKIHRKITEWEWYKNSNTYKLFTHLLFIVNHKERKWQGIIIEKGATIQSLENIAKDTGLTIQNVRTSIKHLKSTQELTQKQHGKYRILKLENYCNYQIANIITNSQLTGNQQGTNSKQECKELKNEKNVYMSLSDFSEFWELYPRHEKKKKAQEKFLKLKIELLPVILKAIENQKLGKDWKGGFIPHPTTWINDERWNDEVGKPEQGGLDLMNLNLK